MTFLSVDLVQDLMWIHSHGDGGRQFKIGSGSKCMDDKNLAVEAQY